MTAGSTTLATQSEPFDKRGVARKILSAQVIQQASALSHHLQQSPTRMVILPMNLQMLRQIADPFAQDRYLDLRGTRILLMAAEVLDNRSLSLRREWLALQLLSLSFRLPARHHFTCIVTQIGA
jgi:hypothetical protein